MVFEDADVSIQIFDLDLGAAVADARGGETIGAKDDFAAVFFTRWRVYRHRGDRKVAVDAAVERLEAEVGRKTACEKEIDVPVDRLEAGGFLRITAEADFHGSVDGVCEAGAAHSVELDVAVHIACDEMAVHVANDDAAFVDGAQIDAHVTGYVENKIHFHDVAVFMATALPAAAVFAIAAERAVNVKT